MALNPLASTFSWALSASNTARHYFLLGETGWNSDSTAVTFVYKLRFYKTSATAGSNSTLDPLIKAIYGMR